METVFDHNLTAEEIERIGFLDPWQVIRHGLDFPNPITPDNYRTTITADAAAFDLGLLFDFRGNIPLRDRYWARVPEKAAEYLRGFDNEAILVLD